MEVSKQDLLKIAFLIESNNHLSASLSGLTARAANRNAALSDLLWLLKLTTEEFQKLIP